MSSKTASDLTAAARKKLPSSDFAVSAKSSNTGKPAYPIEDEQHARSALGFAKMHGDKSDYEKVRAKVKAKYPGLEKDSMAAMADELAKIAAVSFPAGHPGANLFGTSRPVAPMSRVAREAAAIPSRVPPAPPKPVVDVSRGMDMMGDRVKPQPTSPISGPLDFSGRKTPPPLPVRKVASLNDAFIVALQKLAEMRLAPPARLPRQNSFTPAVVGAPPKAQPAAPVKKPLPPAGPLNPGGGMC